MSGILTESWSPARSRTDPSRKRPLWLSAAVAGAVAAGTTLMCCMSLALVGWYASDAGGHGDTRDALRVGTDAWLLGLGTPLQLTTASVSVMPLGLTAFSVFVTFRLGRWAASTSLPDDVTTTALGAVVLSVVHGLCALVAAVLASTPAAQLSGGRAFAGALLVGAVGGSAGLIAGSGIRGVLRDRLPESLRAVLVGGLAAALLLQAAGAVLVFASLLGDFGAAANVLSRLHADAAGGALYTAVVAGVAPNAAALGASYLLGPGFAVGTGTLVSPAAVVLGPVPAFPLLAALPDAGPGPGWASALVAAPVVLAAVSAASMVRRFPHYGYEAGALRGLGAGAAGGVLTGLLVGLAGGSAGPGRMADVGAPFTEILAAGVVAMSVGGVVGGVAMTWWQRRS